MIFIFFMEYFSLIVIAGIFLAMAYGALCIVLCLNCIIACQCITDDGMREYCFPPRNSTPYRHLLEGNDSGKDN